MSKRDLRHRILDGLPLSFIEPPSEEGQPNKSWHMIALEGSWEGHPMGGFSLTRQMFDQMLDYFRGSKVEIPAEYEHATFWSGMFGGKAPASGWLKNMEIRNGAGGDAQLWANFEWTNTAAGHIREREYRYLSPVIVFNTKDRKSGKLSGASIHSVALTNTPFLEELPEVRLNSLPTFELERNIFPSEEKIMTEEQIRALAKALGLSESANANEIIEASKHVVALAQSGAGMLETLGLELNTPKDKALAAILELKNPANDPGEVAALRNRVQELEADKSEREATELVAVALNEGKLTAPGTDQYTWALKFARTNPEAFKEWSLAAPRVVPNKSIRRDPAQVARDNGKRTYEPDETGQIYDKQLGLTEEDHVELSKYID